MAPDDVLHICAVIMCDSCAVFIFCGSLVSSLSCFLISNKLRHGKSRVIYPCLARVHVETISNQLTELESRFKTNIHVS